MTWRPGSVAELQALLPQLPAARVRAGGTKSSPCRCGRCEACHRCEGCDEEVVTVELTGLSGITDYSPDEGVFTAHAATPLRDIEGTLHAHGQHLPFDPPLLEEGATIGGTVAAGVNGPGRYRYGGVRDFLIGVRLVDGEGRAIRSGGKVVKNAAGFLLHHALVGSLGRFGIMTELTFKVFPRPEAQQTLVVECGTVADAAAAARAIELARRDCAAIDFDDNGRLQVRLAGRAEALESRVARMAELLAERPAGLKPMLSAVMSATDATDAAWWGRALVPPALVKNEDHPYAGESWVKVVSPLRIWEQLRPFTSRAHFMCAGSVAWLVTTQLEPIGETLLTFGLSGLVFRGPRAGSVIGHQAENAFEQRVRHVLDPRGIFSAAPNSR